MIYIFSKCNTAGLYIMINEKSWTKSEHEEKFWQNFNKQGKLSNFLRSNFENVIVRNSSYANKNHSKIKFP